MKTKTQKWFLGAAVAAAMVAGVPAQADDSLYLPAAVVARQVKQDIDAEIERSNAAMIEQVRRDAQTAISATASNDAGFQVVQKREGAFWM